MKSLVSIIIPTYNRAHLISETLDSIIAQKYTNWECIIVDDGSIDNTNELIVGYCEKDKRIQYHQRPINRPKGANACRNYGFELSKGEYIKWFDSDDIMLPEHLETLVHFLQKENVDFVVGDFVNFEDDKSLDKALFNFDKNKVVMDAVMFAKGQIQWITDDFLGKRNILENILFNEKLEDGQEYNLFVRLLLQNTNGIFINKILTRMRIHPQSLGVINKQDEINHKRIMAKIKILTLEDIFHFKDKNLNHWFLSGYIQYSYLLALNRSKPPFLLKGFFYVVKVKNLLKGFVFLLSLTTVFFLKKGYKLNKYSRS